jgi:hypothetical protein
MANNVTEKKSTEVADAIDMSWFEADAGKGNESIGQDDLALPFLKILSGLDPILDSLETARKGDIYNTVSGAVYKGKEGIRVIPCAYQRRYIQWAPRGSGTGAPIAIFGPSETRPKTERSSEDNKDYVVGGDGSYLEETAQHFVVILNADGSAETALISMKSTQLKKSRKWNSMIAGVTMQGANGPFNPPRYSTIFKLVSKEEQNSKGSWHGWEMSMEGTVSDKAIFSRCKAFCESVEDGDIVAKHSEEDVPSSNKNSDDIPF